jgi:hypothetical protein
MAAKMMHQKIPAELDEAMKLVSMSDNPEALQKLANEQAEGPNITGPQGYGPEQWRQQQNPVPNNEPGTPVMTHRMAEEAHYLNTVKGMSVRDIAQYFTDRGDPVSKATIARYIDDVDYEFSEFHNNRWRKVRIALSIGGLWIVSVIGADFLLKFLHLF